MSSDIIKIDNKIIGRDYPVFIIAEAGVNHNGSLELAKKLIDAAADAGADAVKFQTFSSDTLVTRDAGQADYQIKNTGKAESQYDMLKRLELKREYHVKLQDHAKEKGIMFTSTPSSDDDTDFLDELGMPLFKVGSSDTNNIPFLKHIAKKGRPMIISTGMSTLDEIKEAISTIREAGNLDLVVLQCTTQYPTPMRGVNLKAMLTIQEKCDVLIGYSDHTIGIEVPIAAVALGAVVIEKHFTLDKSMEGPDHKASLEPDELKSMVDAIRNIEKALGSGEKKLNEAVMKVAEVAQKSIVANSGIKVGDTITESNIIIKRPGTGIKPKRLPDVLGKKAIVNISSDTLIKWEDIE